MTCKSKRACKVALAPACSPPHNGWGAGLFAGTGAACPSRRLTWMSWARTWEEGARSRRAKAHKVLVMCLGWKEACLAMACDVSAATMTASGFRSMQAKAQRMLLMSRGMKVSLRCSICTQHGEDLGFGGVGFRV